MGVELRGCVEAEVAVLAKLPALVYDILPSTTAVFSYAIGPRKRSANEQFFCWCSNSSKFVTNNSELCKSRGVRPALPVPNKPDKFCGRKATMN